MCDVVVKSSRSLSHLLMSSCVFCYGVYDISDNVNGSLLILIRQRLMSKNLHLRGFIIRPHRSTTYADTAYCYRPSSLVCLSVGPIANLNGHYLIVSRVCLWVCVCEWV